VAKARWDVGGLEVEEHNLHFRGGGRALGGMAGGEIAAGRDGGGCDDEIWAEAGARERGCTRV